MDGVGYLENGVLSLWARGLTVLQFGECKISNFRKKAAIGDYPSLKNYRYYHNLLQNMVIIFGFLSIRTPLSFVPKLSNLAIDHLH